MRTSPFYIFGAALPMLLILVADLAPQANAMAISDRQGIALIKLHARGMSIGKRQDDGDDDDGDDDDGPDWSGAISSAGAADAGAETETGTSGCTENDDGSMTCADAGDDSDDGDTDSDDDNSSESVSGSTASGSDSASTDGTVSSNGASNSVSGSFIMTVSTGLTALFFITAL